MFGWIARHWRAIAVGVAAVVVGVGLTVLTGGLLGVPALVALGGGIVGGGGLTAAFATAVGAFGSGITAYLLGNYLEGRESTVGGALREGGMAVLLTFATLGLSRVAAPVVSRVLGRVPAAAASSAGAQTAEAAAVAAAEVGAAAPALRVGVVGYSGQRFDEAAASRMLQEAFDEVARLHPGTPISVVSGWTDLGIPALAYRGAAERGWNTVGYACSQACDFPLYPVNVGHTIGTEWGQESAAFLENIDVLIRVGGGNQARAETAAMQASGRPVFEFELAALPKDAPAPAAAAASGATAGSSQSTGFVTALDRASTTGR